MRLTKLFKRYKMTGEYKNGQITWEDKMASRGRRAKEKVRTRREPRRAEVERPRGKSKRRSKRKKIIISIIVLMLVIGGVWAAYELSRYNRYRLDEMEFNENPLHSDGVRNIALFGLDGRGRNDFSGLSDTIMMITLDYYNGEIKMTSFMRDSIVRIDRPGGSTFTRQNHAFSYGGPSLAVQTLNTNYDLDIEDFIAINFSGFEMVVNRLRRYYN